VFASAYSSYSRQRNASDVLIVHFLVHGEIAFPFEPILMKTIGKIREKNMCLASN
jgi:hypothetical protein